MPGEGQADEPEGPDDGWDDGDDAASFEDWSDAELVGALERSPTNAAVWIFVRVSLLEYLDNYLHWAVLSGNLPRLARERHHPITLNAKELAVLRDDKDLRAGLVLDAALHYLEYFERSVVAGKAWRSDGGASLRTYAGNGGIYALVDRIRAWQRREQHETCTPPTDLSDLVQEKHGAPATGPEDFVIGLDEARRLLERAGTAGDGVAEAIRLRVDTGASWHEIAARLGMGRKALLNGLKRLRASLRGHGETKGYGDD